MTKSSSVNGPNPAVGSLTSKLTFTRKNHLAPTFSSGILNNNDLPGLMRFIDGISEENPLGTALRCAGPVCSMASPLELVTPPLLTGMSDCKGLQAHRRGFRMSEPRV